MARHSLSVDMFTRVVDEKASNRFESEQYQFVFLNYQEIAKELFSFLEMS